jgi:hypothetical protein
MNESGKSTEHERLTGIKAAGAVVGVAVAALRVADWDDSAAEVLIAVAPGLASPSPSMSAHPLSEAAIDNPTMTDATLVTPFLPSRRLIVMWSV